MKSCILSLILFLSTLGVIAQGIVVDSLGVAVNESELSADPSAILDVSSNSKGVLIPRLTTAEIQAIQNPVEGLLVFNANDQVFMYYQNSSWHTIAELDDIPVDGDSDPSNELITNFWIEKSKYPTEQLIIREGKKDHLVELSQLSPWKIEEDKELFTRESDARVAIGRDTVFMMDDTGGFYKGQFPKLDICTGDSEQKKGGFLDLMSIHHSKCEKAAVLRRLGMNLSLRSDFADEYDQGGGMIIESYEAYGASPMLKIYLMDHSAINLVKVKDFPWVGIHTSKPECDFFVNGDAGGTTAWKQFSDSTLKQNVQEIDSALNIVENMRGVYFEWKADSEYSRPEGQQVGFIAQELESYLPQVVGDTTTGRYMTVSYASITPVLAEAIKELKAQKDSEIEALNTELAGKENEIETLQTEIQALQTEYDQLRSTVEALQSTVEAMQE